MGNILFAWGKIICIWHGVNWSWSVSNQLGRSTLCSKSSYNLPKSAMEKAREAEKTGVRRKAVSNHKSKKMKEKKSCLTSYMKQTMLWTCPLSHCLKSAPQNAPQFTGWPSSHPIHTSSTGYSPSKADRDRPASSLAQTQPLLVRNVNILNKPSLKICSLPC